MSSFMSFTKTAMKNLFSKPATTSYPFVPKEYPERTRGHVEINIDECIMCGMCMRNCPPRAITVDRASGKWTIARFDCIQCGYCVEGCPKKCLSIVPGYQEPEPEKKSDTYTKPVVEKPAETANAAGGTPAADTSVCVFCTLCAKKCPAGALTVDRNEKLWKVDEEVCIHCGLCASNCPKKCISMK